MTARVPYLTAETTEGDAHEVLTQLSRRGLRMHIIEAMANSQGTIRNVLRLGNSLMQYTKLPARHRELSILWAALELDSPYEWIQHERFARHIGITDTELAALRAGRLDDASFDDADRLVLRFVTSVLDRNVSDEQFAELEKELGTEAVVDLIVAISWWGGALPLVVSALRVEPEEGETWSR
jgi:alkylhydroperoxidase family enzyme